MDGTYFRTKDVTPWTDGQTIYKWDGENYRASWGSSNVRSMVTIDRDNIVVIDVTGWHKHTVSPVGGTYYFVKDDKGNWVKRRKNSKQVKAAL
jgi:hypothetical protein